MTSAYSQAVAAYQDVAKQSPSDASIQVALGQTAEQAGDTKTAIAAYKQFLKLAPDDSLAPAVKARIKTLQQQPSRLHRLAGARIDSRPHKPGGKRDELRHQDRTGE